MQRRLGKLLPWSAIAAAGALSLGLLMALADTAGWLPGRPGAEITRRLTGPQAPSPVLALAQQAPSQRAAALAELANDGDPFTRQRARYLLAVDRIHQGRGGQALPLLETLEADYPQMAPYVLLRRGEAQRATGDRQAAIATWQSLVKRYGDRPAAAEALYYLGQSQPQVWDQLLKRFPAHPRSVEIAHKRLVETPQPDDEKDLLLIMARHGLHHPDVITYVDRLVERYGSQLSPEDWQAVGFAYWEHQHYGAAGRAYAKAPDTPRNLYRAARGVQLGQERLAAIAAYQRLQVEFPEAPETATGMLKLSYLVDEETALTLLNQVIEQFPDRAGEALLEKAAVLQSLNSPESAAQARKSVLSQHSDSETAADLRMRYAWNAADAGNWSGALNWAQQVLAENPQSDRAPEAGFWAAKWTQRAGDGAAATDLFARVLRDYPESYYAWRSAVALGWDVGNFDTVRSLRPAVQRPAQRQPLPAGSDTLQELYLLGQDQTAWSQWQVEFTQPQTPTVAEQFTDGVLRLGVGDHLDGIFMVDSLDWRDSPEEQAAHTALQEHPAYWQALYPFPFAQQIGRWSKQRQLNPLLVMALIRQESRFEPKIRSVVGATGLMQVMPETAAWIQSQIGLADYTLNDPEDNLQLGTWYLDYTHREYGNSSLYAVASYNAGPGNVADWIARNNTADADEFVHQIPFPETKNYVMAVFGGYWNYLRLYNPAIQQRLSRHQQKSSSRRNVSLYN